MNEDDRVRATAETVSGLTSAFMLDGATYVAGAGLGFEALDFYFCGRGGVLGDVDPAIVTAALAFFNPETVARSWTNGRAVMPRSEAAEAFAGCGASWADAHLGDDVDWSRLSELASTIVASASVIGAPLFAGWRAMPVPAEPKQAAHHQLNVLRELRMARHASAVVSVAIDPADAVRHRSPHMRAIFGWDEAAVDPGTAARWDEAEALTNRATARDYAVLSDAEAAELVDLCAAASASVTS
jgi:hypothetical protein